MATNKYTSRDGKSFSTHKAAAAYNKKIAGSSTSIKSSPTGLSFDTLKTAQSPYGTDRELLAQKAIPNTAPVLSAKPVQLTAANGFGAGSPYVSELDQLSIDRYKTSQKPINRDAIRKQKVAEFQAQIDATNQIFSNLVSQANIQGEGRLGQQRAISARSGNLQQPRGEAQKEQVIGYNNQIVGDIQARKQLAVTGIMTEAQDRADAEYAQKQQAKELGAQNYLQYLSGAEERKGKNAETVLQSLLAQGLTLEDIPQEQFASIANSLRMTPQELQNIYRGELAKSKAEAAQAEYEKFLKDREFGLKEDEFGFEQDKFGAEFGLKEDQFGFDKDKFGAEFGLKQDEFGFSKEKFGAEFGLKRDEFGFEKQKFGSEQSLKERQFAFDQNYKGAQLDIDYQKLDIEQKKLLAEGSSKKLTAEELIKFGNLPAGTTWEDIQGQSPVAKLSGEEKKLNALAISAFDSLSTINKELFGDDNNFNRSKVLGAGLWARTYGNAITNLADVIGRLRSGGAITSDEEKRFRGFLPKGIDSETTIRNKLKSIELMFKAIDPTDATRGVQSTDSLKSQLDGGSGGTNPKVLGSLSEKYESGGRPEAIGYDNTGGWSYGTYQLAHDNVNRFLAANPTIGKAFSGLQKGTQAFNNKWKEVAAKAPQQFASAQKNFIAQTHFQPQVNKLTKLGFNVNKYSNVVKDVIWSTAVQHGANTDVIAAALKKVGNNASESELVKAIYNERWSGGQRFARSTANVKQSVYNRFFGKNGELNLALSKIKNNLS
jgi:hypothetical protein